MGISALAHLDDGFSYGAAESSKWFDTQDKAFDQAILDRKKYEKLERIRSREVILGNSNFVGYGHDKDCNVGHGPSSCTCHKSTREYMEQAPATTSSPSNKSTQRSTVTGNPNKFNWELISFTKVGKAAVVKIHYPDCTNYEGNKIMVYDDAAEAMKLIQTGGVDPHFCEDHYSPVARFKPDEAGMNIALKFAESL